MYILHILLHGITYANKQLNYLYNINPQIYIYMF